MPTSDLPEKRLLTRRSAGLSAGLVLLLLTLWLPPPGGLSEPAWRTAGVGLLMAVWWVTEAVPIPATSLAPLVLFPLLGIAGMEEAASPYAHPLIFLFMGGFMIALALERWGLPRRVSLRIVAAMGARPTRLVAGFMVSTAFFSMWVSNTATTLMMLPIGLSVIGLVTDEEESGGRRPTGVLRRPFSVALMLGIAYSASIGGLGTLIGTPPNAFLAGYMSESYGVEIGFARWMLIGLPLVMVALPLVYLILTRGLFSLRPGEIPGAQALIRRRLREMGPLTTPERRVAGIFGLTAGLWVTRPLLDDVVTGLTDAGIAVLGAILLFIVPAGSRREPPTGPNTAEEREDRRGWDGPEAPPEDRGAAHRFGTLRLLDWDTASGLPWGVLVLFGGGLSLASAISSTGLTGWIGEAVRGMAGVSPLVLVLGVASVIVLLTELTSNTATAAAFLPVAASVAVGVGQNPFLLAVPAALAASCAFMLPVATPPNAIVYGSGHLSIRQMATAGVWLNLLSLFLVTVVAYLLLPLVLGVEIGAVPEWATP